MLAAGLTVMAVPPDPIEELLPSVAAAFNGEVIEVLESEDPKKVRRLLKSLERKFNGDVFALLSLPLRCGPLHASCDSIRRERAPHHRIRV